MLTPAPVGGCGELCRQARWTGYLGGKVPRLAENELLSSGDRTDHGRIAPGMKIRLHALSGMVVALTLTSPPIADRDCRIAAERREAAVAQVIDALRAYKKCVLSGKRGMTAPANWTSWTAPMMNSRTRFPNTRADVNKDQRSRP
jgi:hypothetical protein